MTASLWPEWLSTDHVRRLSSVGDGRFSWSARADSVTNASVLAGRCVRKRELTEINVCIRRDFPDLSVVGVYPCGEGFWTRHIAPSVEGSLNFFTGSIDDVLDMADTWIRGG